MTVSFFSRQILRILFAVIVFGFVLGFAVPWAIRPFWRAPAGLCASGTTYSQLIVERYPKHLIDPTWLGNDMYWIFAETSARLGVVSIGVCLVVLILLATRSSKRQSRARIF